MNSFYKVLLLFVVCNFLNHPLNAQVQRRNYNLPQKPVISPWMNLYNSHPGPLDNYHTYVQPQIALHSRLYNQDQRLQSQGSEITSLSQEINNPNPRIPVRPTGTGSTFQELSHYYPQSKPVVIRRYNWSPQPLQAYGGYGVTNY